MIRLQESEHMLSTNSRRNGSRIRKTVDMSKAKNVLRIVCANQS